MRTYLALLFVLKLLFINFYSYSKDDSCLYNINELKINQLQILGSHNSYHKRANKFVLRFLKGLSGILPKEINPKD